MTRATDERERAAGEPEAERGRERVDTSHLEGVEDGCGCAEVWEHLSEGRDTDSEADSGEDAERGAAAVETTDR